MIIDMKNYDNGELKFKYSFKVKDNKIIYDVYEHSGEKYLFSVSNLTDLNDISSLKDLEKLIVNKKELKF